MRTSTHSSCQIWDLADVTVDPTNYAKILVNDLCVRSLFLAWKVSYQVKLGASLTKFLLIVLFSQELINEGIPKGLLFFSFFFLPNHYLYSQNLHKPAVACWDTSSSSTHNPRTAPPDYTYGTTYLLIHLVEELVWKAYAGSHVRVLLVQPLHRSGEGGS